MMHLWRRCFGKGARRCVLHRFLQTLSQSACMLLNQAREFAAESDGKLSVAIHWQKDRDPVAISISCWKIRYVKQPPVEMR